MNNRKIHKKFLNELNSIEIPPVGEAWQAMQKNLNKEEKKRPVIAWKWFYLAAIFFLLTGFGWWFFGTHLFTFADTSSQKAQIKSANDTLVNKEKRNKSDERNTTTFVKEIQPANDIRSKLPGRSVTDLSNQMTVQDAHKNVVKLRKNRSKINAVNTTRPGQHLIEGPGNDDSLTDDTAGKGNFDSGRIQKQPVKNLLTNSNKEKSGDETKSEADKVDDVLVQAGLQWTAQLPVSNSYKYFAGPNGFSQPYRLLLPGIWISLQVRKILLSIEVNPFATAVLANKPYATKNTISGPDIIIETRTLHKIFGTTAGVGVNYNIGNKWWLGGRMDGNFWRTGTGTIKGEKINAPGTSSSVVYENNFALKDSSWSGFSKFQLGTGAQLLYKQLKWQAGLQYDYYIVPLIDKAGQKNKSAVQLFIRWALYQDKK